MDPRTEFWCHPFDPLGTSGFHRVELIPSHQGNSLEVLEVTGRFHHDLTKKVHPVVFQGVQAKAQVRQMSVAHKCERKKATASHIQVARV